MGLTAVRTTQSWNFSAALKGSGAKIAVNSCHGFPEETPAPVAAATARPLKRIGSRMRWLAARICRSRGGMRSQTRLLSALLAPQGAGDYDPIPSDGPWPGTVRRMNAETRQEKGEGGIWISFTPGLGASLFTPCWFIGRSGHARLSHLPGELRRDERPISKHGGAQWSSSDPSCSDLSQQRSEAC